MIVLNKQVIIRQLGMVKGPKLNRYLKEMSESEDLRDKEVAGLVQDVISKLEKENLDIEEEDDEDEDYYAYDYRD